MKIFLVFMFIFTDDVPGNRIGQASEEKLKTKTNSKRDARVLQSANGSRPHPRREITPSS